MDDEHIMEINASANTVGIENAINLSEVEVNTVNQNSPFPAKNLQGANL